MKEFAIGALIILALFQYNTNQELSKRVKNLETLATSQEEEISQLNDLAVSYDEALTEAMVVDFVKHEIPQNEMENFSKNYG